MSTVNRSCFTIGWKVVGGEKWLWDVVIYDPAEPEEYSLVLVPLAPASIGWPSPEEARIAAATALRDLADRIERGEP